MAAVTAAVGAVAAGVGGAMSANAKAKAASRAAAGAKFSPYDIRGAGGSVTFGSDGRAIVSADAKNQRFQDLFASGGQNILSGGGFGQDAINYASQAGSAGMPSAFMGALANSDTTSAMNAGNAFSQFSQGNAMLGQAAGMQGLGLAQQFGTQQTGINEGMAQQLFGQGLNALGNTDFSSLADSTLARQRALARPGEERAVNSKFQNLFNRGALSQTGGAQQIGELALAQEQADITRSLGADQFANMLGQQNRQFGLNAMQQGFGARQQDQSFNLNAANLFGNLGQNMLNFGQSSAGQGAQMQLGLNELQNTRGQQRLANVQGLLGFGQQMGTGNLNQALAMFGGSQAIDNNLRQLVALGGNLGSAQSGANAAAGQIAMQGAGSPVGSFLGGMGSGLLTGFGGLGG